MAQKARFTAAELEEALKKLTARAINLFASTGLLGVDTLLKGTGKSPEDLAMDTLTMLLSGELNYHRSKGKLDAFLSRVMDRDFIDLLRSKAQATVLSSDPGIDGENRAGETTQSRIDKPSNELDPFNTAAAAEFIEQLSNLVRGDAQLEEFAYAVLELGATRPQDIAGLLKTDSTDVQNRKKRMRRRLAEYFGRQEKMK